MGLPPHSKNTHLTLKLCVNKGLDPQIGSWFFAQINFLQFAVVHFFSKLTNTYLASNLKSALELTLDCKQFWLKVLLTIFNWHKCIAIWLSKILKFCCLLTQKMIKWMKSNRIYLVWIASAFSFFFFYFCVVKNKSFLYILHFFSQLTNTKQFRNLSLNRSNRI